MSLTTHELGFEVLDGIDGVDSLCLFVSEDERPLKGAAGYVDWRMCGALSQIVSNAFFTGARKDSSSSSTPPIANRTWHGCAAMRRQL